MKVEFKKNTHTFMYLLTCDLGNANVQENVYNFFINNSESEKFFKQLFYIMNDEIIYIAKYKGEKTSIGSVKL